MKHLIFVVLLVLSSTLFGQTSVPAGTILPVQLESTIRSNKAKRGQVVTGRIMQDVPLPSGSKIKRGSKVIGHLLDVVPATNESQAKVALRFDTLLAGNRKVPLITNLRALASMLDVDEAQVPETGPDRGTSEFDWNTTQIGGDADYHGSVIANEFRTVGKSIPPNGALVQVSAKPGSECRGEFGSDGPQATWLFASDACGLYGYPGMKLVHAGRSIPVGEIVMESEKGNLNIRAGSGMLLRVD